MRKRVFGKKFSRNRASRNALFRSLYRAIILEKTIVTTKVKAKAIQRDLDKLIKMVAEGSVASRRRALSVLGNDRVSTDVLFRDFVELSKKRTSGYTRTINLMPRLGDKAQMVRLEWTDKVIEVVEEPKKKVKKVTEKVVEKKEEVKEKKTVVKAKKVKKEVKK